MLPVSGSMSISRLVHRNREHSWRINEADGRVQTQSPWPTPSARQAMCNAAVPELTATPNSSPDSRDARLLEAWNDRPLSQEVGLENFHDCIDICLADRLTAVGDHSATLLWFIFCSCSMEKKSGLLRELYSNPCSTIFPFRPQLSLRDRCCDY